MSARSLDLLHIIWLLLERHGLDPREVDQAWNLCQSVWRASGAHQPGSMAGQRPHTPGLALPRGGEPPRSGLCPCVLPRSRMWVNSHLRFARGAELLQTQGVDIPCVCPGWQSEPDALLQHVAGNMYCLPVVAWYTLWGLATCLPGAVLTSEGLAAAAGHQAASAAAWEASAESKGPKLAAIVWAPRLLRALLQASPVALLTATGTGPTTVRVGSLCSGPDFVKDFLAEVLGSISHLPGGPALVMENVFACECDERAWGLRARSRLPHPVHLFKDILMLRSDQSIPCHSGHPVACGAVGPV